MLIDIFPIRGTRIDSGRYHMMRRYRWPIKIALRANLEERFSVNLGSKPYGSLKLHFLTNSWTPEASFISGELEAAHDQQPESEGYG